MFRKGRSLMALLLCALLLTLLAPGTARAADVSVEVTLPVTVQGPGCTVALLDAKGNTVASADLGADAEGTLSFLCSGVLEHPYTYTLAVTNEDGGGVTYDSRTYTLKVTLHETESGYTYSVIVDDGEAVGAGKPLALSFTNRTETLRPCTDDPPVRKSVDGLPPTDGTFVFVLTRNDDSYPMPNGITVGTMEMEITGQGTFEFGVITFTAEGVYEYTVTEKNTGEAGYTYDDAVYTIHYEITEEANQLQCKRTFLKDGVELGYLTAAAFTNKYEAPPTPTRPPVIPVGPVEPSPTPTEEPPAPTPTPEEPTPTPAEPSPTPDEEEIGDDDPPLGPPPTPGPSGEEDGEDIEDGRDPLAPGSGEEEEEDLEDNQVPLAPRDYSPPTGDESMLGLWIGAAAGSFLMILVVLLLRHRSVRKEDE